MLQCRHVIIKILVGATTTRLRENKTTLDCKADGGAIFMEY